MEANTVKVMVGRLSRLGVSGGRPSGDAAAMADLEMELALLREENARLKVERHRAPDAGRVIERMRHLGQARQVEQLDADGAHGSEASRAILECLAIRDGLVEACHEIQQAMQRMRRRLGGLSLDVQARAGDQAVAGATVTPPADEVDLELAVGARAPSDLSQSAA